MSIPRTLGEYLRWIEEDGAPCDVFRRILYGTDEPCPVCDGSGYDPPDHPCLACHGTGRTKTPGLVERLWSESSASPAAWPDWLADAIRREIGESLA